MHTRIYLIGFMGSGKTTSGKRIARMMSFDFLDLDEWIVDQEGISIPEIFEKHGETYFREKESEAIRTLSTIERTVISTGGGTPCFNDNMKLMNNLGLTIYLKLSPSALLSRLLQSNTRRPLLEGKSEEEMKETIEELLQNREAYYEQAQMVVDGFDAVNERVVNAIQRK